MTIRWLSDDHPINIWWLSDNYPMTIRWLSDDYPMTTRWLSDYHYYWNYLQGSRGCLSLPHSWSLTTGGVGKLTKIIIENWKMATRGKSIKITIESLDDCEKERSTKINIEKLKNGKLGDQHIRSATGCCWTSQISSRQVYQLVLFKWKILHRGGFQNIRKNIVAELNVGHLFEEKIPMLCLQKLFFFSRAKLVLSPNLMFIWVHFSLFFW